MSALGGCSDCFAGGDAAPSKTVHVANVVRESHFAVSIHRCATCGQRIASVSCETVRFSGDDQLDTLAIPITEAEADALVALGPREEEIERALIALSPERRYYACTRYQFGRVWIPPHD